MFNVPVFLLLCALVVIANFIAIPKIIGLTAYRSGSEERKVLLVSTLTNSIFLSVGAVALGSYMAPRMNLSPRFLDALVHLDQPHLKLFHLLIPASVTSIVILVGMLLIQIVLVNRCLTLPSYYSLPISTRLLKEGFLEEIIYRWGLLPTVAGILNIEFLVDADTALLFAVLVCALGSSMLHISDLLRFSFRHLGSAVFSILAVNCWGAIIYGWLFCRYGITAAIVCHGLVILVSSGANAFTRFAVLEDTNQ